MRARRGDGPPSGSRRTPQPPREDRESEEWVDEGSVRSQARDAVDRAAQPAKRKRSRPQQIDPETAAAIRQSVGPQRGARLTERLGQAAAALDRDRLDEARRIVKPLADELPDVAAVRRIAGLTAYRLGHWRKAVSELEAAHERDPLADDLPVIADAYRALRKWRRVDDLWKEIRERSPAQHVMAEGRIVAAGAAADQGHLQDALAIMQPAAQAPKRVREHHLRQWYVLGDLHDRAGDPIAAARFFHRIAASDQDFADVRARLDALGR